MPLELQGGSSARADALAQRRLGVLQHLTAALARARTYSAIASVIIDDAMPALKAEVGVVALASEDGRMLTNVGFKGVDEATQDAWQAYPVESPVPVAEAALTGKTIVVRTIAERNERYPVLAQIHGIEHGGPVVAFPLFVDERLLGVLAFCWGSPIDLDQDDLSFLGTLADQCALAIERSRLYDLAEQEKAKLREANERKDEFLAMLAHELRNPLAPIRSAADLLASLARDEPIARVQGVIARQAEHMKRIVDDLLDVSRIARNSMRLELVTVDLTALVRATTSDHSSAFARAGVDLDVRLPTESVWTRADVTRLTQALANLLHNALKFTPRGRSVIVTLSRDAADRGAVEVQDRGCGIDATLLPRLFEPFSQADRSLARTSGGLGLGLALVQGLIRLHGGEVTAASEGAGKGATFRIALPLLAAAASVPDREPLSPAPEGKFVLIVEDNVDAAEMLALVVQSLGHEVRVAHDAADALAILDAWEPHFILSDLGLPDIDGYDFARRVRAREGAQPARLVAISGYGSEADKSKAREAGFDHHVTKPIDVTTLARVLVG